MPLRCPISVPFSQELSSSKNARFSHALCSSRMNVVVEESKRWC
jgi:hypothetical protein